LVMIMINGTALLDTRTSIVGLRSRAFLAPGMV
jgi:hypothetical protein